MNQPLQVSDNLKKSYLVRKINKWRLEALKKYAGDSILDVGCGNGSYVFELKNTKKIKGVDYQKFDSWDEAPELFSILSADNLSSIESDSVDTICSFEVLEHMKDPEKVLRDFQRICKKNIIITVPNCTVTKGMKDSKFIYYHWIDPTHIQFFEKDNLTNLIKKCGFEIEVFSYINRANFLPILKESFGLHHLPDNHYRVKVLKWLVNRYSKQEYYITMLIVANKINNNKELQEQELATEITDQDSP